MEVETGAEELNTVYGNEWMNKGGVKTTSDDGEFYRIVLNERYQPINYSTLEGMLPPQFLEALEAYDSSNIVTPESEKLVREAFQNGGDVSQEVVDLVCSMTSKGGEEESKEEGGNKRKKVVPSLRFNN